MSNAANKLAALKAAFEQKTETSASGDWKKFYPFWKIPDDGVAVVRFLPDLDESNPLGFLVKKLTHELTVNGQRKTVPCLSMWDEKCPICDLSRSFYDDKNEEMGKKYYRKVSYVGQIIVIESPIEHDQTQLVKLVEFGPQVYKQIQAAFSSGDLEEAPYELKGGYHFRFRKTKTGSGQNSYSTSNFAPKQSDLGDDIIDQLATSMYNLNDYRGAKPEFAAVQAMLVADQTGSNVASAVTTASATTKAATTVQPAKKAEVVEVAEDEVKAEATPVAKTGGMSVIEQLRARAAQAKAAQSE